MSQKWANMAQEQREAKKAKFRAWYEKHKVAFNLYRKEKYRRSPEKHRKYPLLPASDAHRLGRSKFWVQSPQGKRDYLAAHWGKMFFEDFEAAVKAIEEIDAYIAFGAWPTSLMEAYQKSFKAELSRATRGDGTGGA